MSRACGMLLALLVVEDASPAPGPSSNFQPSMVVGRVTQAESHVPIRGARIALLGTDLTTKSGKGGMWRLVMDTPGRRALRVTAKNRLSTIRFVELGTSPMDTLEIALLKVPSNGKAGGRDARAVTAPKTNTLSSPAKRFRIEGVVLGARREPIAGANVQLLPANGDSNRLHLGASTSDRGHFVIVVPDTGDYVIRISLLGCEDRLDTLHVSERGRDPLEIQLQCRGGHLD